MLFNSETYFAFLPAVVAIYWLPPAMWRPAFLLVARYYLYASWNAPLLLLVGAYNKVLAASLSAKLTPVLMPQNLGQVIRHGQLASPSVETTTGGAGQAETHVMTPADEAYVLGQCSTLFLADYKFDVGLGRLCHRSGIQDRQRQAGWLRGIPHTRPGTRQKPAGTFARLSHAVPARSRSME